MRSVHWITAFLLITTARFAGAQERPLLRFGTNVGLQESAGTFAIDKPLTFFGGSGFFRIEDNLPTSTVFDVNGSVRVWRGLSFGAGYSTTKGEKLAPQYTASVPAAQSNRLNLEVRGTMGGTVHSEKATYALLSWTTPVTERFDVILFGGPAFFELDQDLPDLSVVTAPSGAQALIVDRTRFSKSSTGFHIGMDLDYIFGDRAGFGGTVRYSRASVDIPDGTKSMIIGGFQILTGARVTF